SSDADLWGHVSYGRELLRDGHHPATTTWSYLVTDERWINHENLAEFAAALAVDYGGIWGLSLGKLALALILVGAMLWACRLQGASWLATALCVVTAASGIHFHWQFRPHTFSYTFFAVLIAILTWVFVDWRGDWRGWRQCWDGTPRDVPTDATRRLNGLLWLAPLFVLWTNAHGGFAAGVAVLTAYLGLRGLEAWAWWGRRATGVIARLAATLGLVLMATLLNPYGSDLHAWMLYDVLPARPEIMEWRPIRLIHDLDSFLPIWLLFGLGGVSLLGTSRRRDVTQLVILAILLWQGLAHLRHIVFFAILCGCWFAPHLQSVFDRLVRDFRDRSSASGACGVPPAGLAVGLGLWGLFLLTQLVPRLAEVQVERRRFPVSAMQFMADHQLAGNVMMEMNWAQYAIMCFESGPASWRSSRVAVDGRLRTCYPWETLDIYFDFALGNGGPELRNRSPQSPPFDAGRILSVGSPDLALLWRQQSHSIRVMEAQSDDWVLLYQDGLAQLWGRRSKYDDATSPDYLAPDQRRTTNEPQLGAVRWPALPQRGMALECTSLLHDPQFSPVRR
ncbi:MAG: hypothetical protein ACK5Q5_21310, partial [Planctomycetaceae bacterium]